MIRFWEISGSFLDEKKIPAFSQNSILTLCSGSFCLIIWVKSQYSNALLPCRRSALYKCFLACLYVSKIIKKSTLSYN